VPQHIAVTEAAMTVLGEGRMVRHVAIETQPAEPRMVPVVCRSGASTGTGFPYFG
jgi:hypothetical protein